ncbi:MAG: MATE family efflux transporter [Alphaproteobacteria bacterium]|nr:MAG: MATE family efflux transporter [Alphaproteobacteria bacterium]
MGEKPPFKSGETQKPRAAEAAGAAALPSHPPRHSAIFLEGDIPTHIRRMAVPMGWGILAMTTVALVEAYFLGRLGTQYLAAVTFTFPVVTLLSNLTIGLGSGVSSVLARSIGEAAPQRMREQAICALILSMILVGLFSAIGFFTIEPLFGAMGAKGEAMQLVRSYMRVFYISMIFLVVPMIGNFILRAAGDARTAGWLMVWSAVVTIVLEPVLIFGWLGMPRLEIAGAAWAQAAGRATSFVVVLYILHTHKRMVTFILPPLNHMMSIWWSILRIGGPLAASNMVAPLVLGIITGLLASFGEEVIAGFGVAARIEAIALIPLFAMTSGLGPIVGQNYGAGNISRVFGTIRAAVKFSLYYGVAAGALFLVLHNQVPGLFDDNPDVIRSAGWYLLMVPFGVTAMGVSSGIGASFNGMGNPKPSVTFTIGRMAVLFLPLAFLGAKLFGYVGIYLAGALASVIVGVGAWMWVQHRRRLWGHRHPRAAL